MKRLLSTLLGTVVLTALMVTSALAGPIMDWNYTVDGAFTSWTTKLFNQTGNADTPAFGITTEAANYKELHYSIDGGTYVGPTTAKGYSAISWGDYVWKDPGVIVQDPTVPRSTIGIISKSGTLNMVTDINTGVSSANGDGMTLFHDNHVVYGIQLKSGVARAVLELAPSGYPALPVFSTTLDFNFYETPNNNPDAPGDVFVLMNPEVTQETFALGGYYYTFNFGGSFGLIPEVYRTLLGLPADAVGWVTAEDQYNEYLTSISITAVPTPEPTSIILMGLGLLGIFGLRRRAQA